MMANHAAVANPTNSAMIAASSPGHSRPTPSPAQNVPNVVSSSPTAYFIVFSGTRPSGARTRRPTIATTTIAVVDTSIPLAT